MNILEMVNQIKQNPAGFLMQNYHVQIPQNLNNPNEIIQHLLNTGQVSQSQVNNAMQMRNHPMFKGMF